MSRRWYPCVRGTIPVAMSNKVVPVSMIPAVEDSKGVPAVPYVIDWSMPTNSLAGDVVVKGLRGEMLVRTVRRSERDIG